MLPRKGLLGDPILSQCHCLGPRAHRAKASQIFETRCGNVFEFGRDGSRHFSQLPQRRLVLISSLDVPVGESSRGAEIDLDQGRLLHIPFGVAATVNILPSWPPPSSPRVAPGEITWAPEA